MHPTIVFDVNETLLDLEPVRQWFAKRFDDRPDAQTWFSELLRLSFVSSVTDHYVPFTDLAAAALETVAERSAATASADDMAKISGILSTLPPYPDVASGLDRLRHAGLTIAALTNSPQPTADAQLANAGIAERFDAIMSVDMVNRFKPHRSVYQAAARHLGIEISDLVMVAAHDWDVAGAMAAGASSVFIARPGQLYSPSLARPTMTAGNVDDASHMIIDRYG